MSRSDPASIWAADLPIEPGSRADYRALKAHHYRPGDPATATRTLVIRDPAPTTGDRYLGRSATPRPIAVLVESLPSLSCRLRDQALSGRYGHLPPRPRSALLNQELRCISRVIVDPRWRGLGLAVRLVRDALATATTRYTEALAVMGRVSPFFARAGMTAYERPPLPTSERLIAVLRYAGLSRDDLALPRRVRQRVDRLDTATGELIRRELWRWYRTSAGRRHKQAPSLDDQLVAAQQRLFACPLYYLHDNRNPNPKDAPDERAQPARAEPAAREARPAPG